MQAISQLLDFVSPGPNDGAPLGRAQRTLISVQAVLASLLFAGAWGIAAGSHAHHFALGNAVTVPLLLLVSSVAALPPGLLVFRLTAREGRVSDLLVSHAMACFTGTLVLALLAPIVALYQHSSSWAGPAIALASAFVGLGVACAILLRILGKLVKPGTRRSLVVPVVLLVVLQIAALMQLASVAPAVFPTRTVFGRGVDSVSHVEGAAPEPPL